MSGLRYHETATGEHLEPELGAVEPGDEVWVVFEDGGIAGAVGQIIGDRITVETRIANPEGDLGIIDMSGDHPTGTIVSADIDAVDLDEVFCDEDCGRVESVTVATDGWSLGLGR